MNDYPKEATVRGPYDVLMVDPPWPVKGVCSDAGGGFRRAAFRDTPLPYKVLSWPGLWEVVDHEVLCHAADHHALFLWTLEQYLTEAEQELIARGYRRIHRIIWAKSDGTFIGTIRRTHEYMLWYCKPRLLPVSAGARGRFDSVLRTSAPKHGQNSRKPGQAYAMVDALYPDARKLDAFTREFRVGWDGMGDQRDHFTPLLAPLREVQCTEMVSLFGSEEGVG